MYYVHQYNLLQSFFLCLKYNLHNVGMYLEMSMYCKVLCGAGGGGGSKTKWNMHSIDYKSSGLIEFKIHCISHYTYHIIKVVILLYTKTLPWTSRWVRYSHLIHEDLVALVYIVGVNCNASYAIALFFCRFLAENKQMSRSESKMESCKLVHASFVQ